MAHRENLEEMVVEELRLTRKFLARALEDLDLALVGSIPDNWDEDAILRQYLAAEEVNKHLARVGIFVTVCGVAMNLDGMQRAHNLEDL